VPWPCDEYSPSASWRILICFTATISFVAVSHARSATSVWLRLRLCLSLMFVVVIVVVGVAVMMESKVKGLEPYTRRRRNP